MDNVSRYSLDHKAGLLSFDQLESYTPRRLKVMWLENTLDCRIWGYYCDIKRAVARLHDVCVVKSPTACLQHRGGHTRFEPDVAIIGPRFSINIQSEDDLVGFDRSQNPNLPLLVLQNKMYDVSGWRELVGNVSAKLAWTRAAGAAGAFTWLTRHHEFTRRSGVPHHWLPFGVDVKVFGFMAGTFGKSAQPVDVGFTGASGKDKYPLRNAMLQALQNLSVTSFFGTWLQTASSKQNKQPWRAGDRGQYAREISRTRIWLSTTGPSNIVGTRYFEVLASGTTLLVCNRPPKGEWVYEGLFEDGIHVIMFDSIADMKAKVLYYLEHETERRKVVERAHALTVRIHSWEARAKFISRVAETAIALAEVGKARGYVAPTSAIAANHSSFLGCFTAARGAGLQEPRKSRNKRKLWRYTVSMCQTSCRASGQGIAALLGGGFSSGNGHAHGHCSCAESSILNSSNLRRADDSECASTCNLHDARPCGSARHHALFSTQSL